ncbi:hypothetical protein VTO42DRAFT_5741 [Malbranchea cinnamomea]
MASREASHAGSWYSDDESVLSRQLDHWLDQVPDEIEGIGKLPVPGARVIIAPHAGYAYSGPCAAFAYKALDLSQAKRIFLLGPSHHHGLPNIALSQFNGYSTPLSPDPLPLDTELIAELKKQTANNSTNTSFTTMSPSVDEAEHSLELHLPYIHRLLQRLYPDQPTSSYPPLVPMMVGYTSSATENAFGNILAPYLANPENAFIISSDFCHWGLRFSYTYYVPDAPAPGPVLPLSHSALPQPSESLTASKASTIVEAVSSGRSLRPRDRISKGSGVPAIQESISACDIACMAAIACGHTRIFREALRNTGNTVCGRHPIGVIMAALEAVKGSESSASDTLESSGLFKGKFNFVRYERSSDPISVSDSSVSYVSAFAVL